MTASIVKLLLVRNSSGDKAKRVLKNTDKKLDMTDKQAQDTPFKAFLGQMRDFVTVGGDFV